MYCSTVLLKDIRHMEYKEPHIKNGLVDFEDLFSSSLTFVKELLNK